MSDSYTSITQGLRERLRAAALGLASPTFAGLLVECDNIDTLHKSLEDEYVSLCKRNAELRETVAEHDTGSAETATSDLIPLPLDADRAPICVGDDMQSVSKPDHHGTVYRMELTCDGWWIYFGGVGARPEKCRHYHELAVADVLREFANGIKNQNAGFTELAIAEYAKRLQLAEGDDNE